MYAIIIKYRATSLDENPHMRNERDIRKLFYNSMANIAESMYALLASEGHDHDEIQKGFIEACAMLAGTDIEPPPDVMARHMEKVDVPQE